MSKVSLYQYQTDLSSQLHEDIIDNDFNVLLEGSKLVTSVNAYYLTSPLGSGKTRMISRTIKLLIESNGFEEKIWNFKFISDDTLHKKTHESIVMILVPVSVLTHWEAELKLWDIKFYLISTPKQIKPLSEIKEKVILTSDYRTKDINSEKFFDCDRQIYMFIDEYDTIKLNTKFVERGFVYVKSKICFSANYGHDPHVIPQGHVNAKRFQVTDAMVKAVISLPPPVEIIQKYSQCSILTENYPNLNKDEITSLQSGNIGHVFALYGLTTDDTIVKLFERIIRRKKEIIRDHLIKVQKTTDAYSQMVEDQCDALNESIEKHSKNCFGCKASIPKTSDANNCVSCYEFYCNKCKDLFVGKICHECDNLNQGKSVSGDGTDFTFRTRLQCFQKILQNIKDRPHKESKKTLLYCSYANLLEDLYNFLSDNNLWCLKLEGSSSSRNEIIKKFKMVDTDIYLLCNSLQNSAGIHLPETTDIIIYHDLEDKFDTQVVGRAQRIGRKSALHLHRIVDKDHS